MKTLGALAELLGAELTGGDPATFVARVMPTNAAAADAITFVTKAQYLPSLADTRAAAVIITEELLARPETKLRPGLAILCVRDAYVAFARAAQALAPAVPGPTGVHTSAVIDPSAELGRDVAIGPFVLVGPRVVIGDGAVLHAGVHVHADARVGAGTVLYDHVVVRHGSTIGARCVLHPGVVVGSDGFGFAKDTTDGKLEHVKIPQLGTVVIEDDVELGANVCIDRAALGTTKIGAGTKIDNLVQVGHNVELGRGCILVAQSGVAGSSKLGEGVVLAAQAGIAGHLKVGAGAMIFGQSGVMQDVEPGHKLMGSPAVLQSEHFRNIVRIGKLDSLFARVKKLERLLKPGDD